MTSEVELLDALRSGQADVTRTGAWLDLFLQLAEGRIQSLRTGLADWQSGAALPFAALRWADELAGLCVEQTSPSLSQLSCALADALRRHSARVATPEERQATLQACDELWRQLHQHAAGIPVLTPPHILQKLGSDPN